MSPEVKMVVEAAGIVLALALAWYVGWRCGRVDEREKWEHEVYCLRRDNEHLRKQVGL